MQLTIWPGTTRTMSARRRMDRSWLSLLPTQNNELSALSRSWSAFKMQSMNCKTFACRSRRARTWSKSRCKPCLKEHQSSHRGVRLNRMHPVGLLLAPRNRGKLSKPQARHRRCQWRHLSQFASPNTCSRCYNEGTRTFT